jgi:hypothetical protein
VSKDDPIKIVCARVADMREPVAGSSRITCGACGAACWITTASEKLRTSARGPVAIVCAACFETMPIGANSKVVLTAEQVRDVAAELERRRRTSAERN